MVPNKTQSSDPLDLKYFYNLVIKNWLIIGLTIFLFLILAFLKNKFSTNIYQVSSSIIINEEENGLSQASAELMKGIGLPNTNKNFANEMLVLQSTPLIEVAVKKLDFRVSYFEKEFLRTSELYKSSPFVVVFNQSHPQPVNVPIYVEFQNDKTFRIYTKDNFISLYSFESEQYTQTIYDISLDGKAEYGKNLISEYYDFKIILNENYTFDGSKSTFYFIINTPENIVRNYKQKLEVLPPDLESTVAQLSIKTSVPEKAIDFLNSLAESYLNRDISRKSFVSLKTIEYIDNQLNIVKDSLRKAEDKLQSYRSENKVVDISLQSGRVFDEIQLLEKQKAELLVKQKYHDHISECFNNNKESDIIAPSSMGIDDPLLNSLIEELVKLNSEKVSLIENKQEKNPYLKKISIRIDNLKNMIQENIEYVKKSADISLTDVNSRINNLNVEIQKLPRTQRELLSIERRYNVNDVIFTFLLQKRAEAEITKASYLSDVEVLENADFASYYPVSPKRKVNYIIAFMLGIVIPVSIIHFKELFRKTFSSKNEVVELLNISPLGSVYHNNKDHEMVVTGFPNSHIAESFRMIRSNLNYYIPKEGPKIITITSTISQEGKSFVSLNLASALAAASNKTVLLGFDLRKPKLYQNLTNEKMGISDYLSNQAGLSDITHKDYINNLDVILAGSPPPNPAELISSLKTLELLDELKDKYEYIIIDTAPVGLVSESGILMENADLKIFTVRLNYSLKKETLATINDFNKGSSKNLCLVVNDIPLMKKTKYGYGYYSE